MACGSAFFLDELDIEAICNARYGKMAVVEGLVAADLES